MQIQGIHHSGPGEINEPIRPKIRKAYSMTKTLDRSFDARIDRLADQWLGLCEKLRSIEDIHKFRGIAATCYGIKAYLRAQRMEQRGLEPETGIAGSAVRKYAEEFGRGGAGRKANPGPAISLDDDGGGGDESGGDPDITVLDAG